MRYAILADIHANLAAFQAVLAHATGRGGFDAIWCLGDIVGYGPDPHECLDLLRKHEHLAVAGNHDLAAIGKIDTSDFNYVAARANQWTAQQLTPGDIGYLKNLPLIAKVDRFTLVHGSPREPVWEYILDQEAACENLPYFHTPYCLVGHSHATAVFEETTPGQCLLRRLTDGETIELKGRRLIINPGGVGQPRDMDPRASYVIHDSESRHISCHRVEYDIAATQQKMRQFGLPARLIARLAEGW